MKQFKIRCSKISDIMSNPKKGSESPLSVGAQTYCKLWIKENILFNRHHSFSSKQTAKGNMVEDDAIEFADEILNLGGAIKNKIHFEDEWMQGTPDVLIDDCVIDMKSSWDFSTFPTFDKEPPSEYWWQLQGYMNLTNKNKARLIFTLQDTPYHLIQSEARRYCYNNGYEFSDEILGRFIKQMTYPDVDNSLKIKVYEITRNDESIDRIKEKVEFCKEFINKEFESI